ncbi:MAG: hypothetical protein R3D57_04850 [Hyphomicrobiaceae bacterium]
MKSLIFMMMLSMFLVSAGVVYLSIHRDPLGGAPHVDVVLDPVPPEEQASIEPTVPAVPAPEEPANAAADLLQSPSPTTESSFDLQLPVDNSDEPLTTTAFPIPASDPDALDLPADASGEATAPAAVDQ